VLINSVLFNDLLFNCVLINNALFNCVLINSALFHSALFRSARRWSSRSSGFQRIYVHRFSTSMDPRMRGDDDFDCCRHSIWK